MSLAGIAAARQRTEHVDALVADLSTKLAAVSSSVAVVALGAYGQQELTPRMEVDLLFLHQGELSARWVTEAVCYPLWEKGVRAEPTVRTVAECAADARRSFSFVTSMLDSRLVAGDASLFAAFQRQVATPWRRDITRLRQRVRTDVQHRHSSYAAATASATPDLVAGRGGLLDLRAVRWLDAHYDPCLTHALDFLLDALRKLEDLVDHTPHRLSVRLQERLAQAFGLSGGAAAFVEILYGHTRRVAFHLDGALGPIRDNRQLGSSLAVRGGLLVSERPPPLERSPSLGLRVANLVGLAPPDESLLAWASISAPPVAWDDATRDQFWLMLRAADWRAWDFLDVTGLLTRYFPELREVWRQRATSSTEDLATDHHSFLALRRLHEWIESDDPLAARAVRPLRRRDWLYLAVLLHELQPQAAMALCERIGLPTEVCAGLGFVIGNYRALVDTATRRDLHDEDLLLELATRIGARQRLGMLFLVAAAHDQAIGSSAWSAWKADLMRQLFGRLDSALRHSGETGRRRSRTLEQHRERIARELERRELSSLVPLVPRLPRRYVLTRSPAFVARHLSLLVQGPLADGETRMQAHRHRQPGVWDLLIVARDRPGLLATMAGVLALRGISVLAADAATCSDGLVLDVFTVSAAYGVALERDAWPAISADVQAALHGRVPLPDLLGARPLTPEEADAIHVTVDNSVSQFYSVIEIRAPDQVGLLYRIAAGLHDLGLDIHHAKIATHPQGALDVFYVWDFSGEKLDPSAATRTAERLASFLTGQKLPD